MSATPTTRTVVEDLLHRIGNAEPEHIAELYGEDAVVFGEIRLTARPTGRSYRARFALHLTVRGGLIVRHHVYEDSLAVYRAFAGEDGGVPLAGGLRECGDREAG